jgi:hypothetical protein
MRVAYVPRKHSAARKAQVKYIDSSDGYDALHTLTLMDDDWSPIKDGQGNPSTIKCSSRKIKPWEQVEEGVEEKRFEQAKKDIQAKLNQQAAEKAAEPWTRLHDLLQLHGVEDVNVNPGYGTPPRTWAIHVPATSAEVFLDLFIPYLTQRLFNRTPVLPVVEDSDTE